jgi:hypothetical protein
MTKTEELVEKTKAPLMKVAEAIGSTLGAIAATADSAKNALTGEHKPAKKRSRRPKTQAKAKKRTARVGVRARSRKAGSPRPARNTRRRRKAA